MKNLFFFLVLLFSISCFSQRIAGKVFSNDKVPLPGANVFLDGTTISTSTDENGNFVIEYDPDAKNILVFSYMGFENQYVTDLDFKKDIVVYMEIAKNTLKEIVVRNEKDIFTREQRLKIFREYFIGETRNNAKITIENEDDIHFKYDKQNHVLQAYSDKPLVIINSYLGYQIIYDLHKFEVTFGSLSIYSRDVIKSYYAGFSHFKEINNSDLILKRREEAYKGSQINFFRNLANGTWSKDQFMLFQDDKKVISSNCFKIFNEEYFTRVEVVKQSKAVENKNSVASFDLLFNNKEKSSVIFETNTFNIYKYGNNSNIENIVFTGIIADERIAEMLPLNYGLN